MEKLSLDKFRDVKLDNKQLSFVHAGDTCTGGGGGMVMSGGNPITNQTIGLINADGHTSYLCYHYESDSIDDCGNTSYSGACRYWS